MALAWKQDPSHESATASSGRTRGGVTAVSSREIHKRQLHGSQAALPALGHAAAIHSLGHARDWYTCAMQRTLLQVFTAGVLLGACSLDRVGTGRAHPAGDT